MSHPPPPPPRTPTFKNDVACLNLQMISKNTQEFYFYRFIVPKYSLYQKNILFTKWLSQCPYLCHRLKPRSGVRISLFRQNDKYTYWPWFESTLDIMIDIFRDNQFRSHQCHFVYKDLSLLKNGDVTNCVSLFFAWQYTIHNEIAINEHAACRRTYKHPRTTFLGQRSKRHVSGTRHVILFRWINY